MFCGYRRKYNCSGQSLIEVIIAMAIFALISVSLVSLVLGGLSLLSEGGIITEASGLAEEGIEAVRAIKNRAWNELVYSQSAVSQGVDRWEFVGEGSSEQIGKYTRIISFENIYRDDSFDIVEPTNPEARLDLESKMLSIDISWTNNRNKLITKTWDTIITNWDSKYWQQEDWEGGSGQNTWSAVNRYYNDDGNIDVSASNTLRLLEIATSTYATSGQLESSNFEANDAIAFVLLSWTEEINEACSSCRVRVQIKTAEDQAGNPANWSSTWSGPEGEDGDEDDYYEDADGELIHIDHNRDKWIKYRISLDGETAYTPVLSEIKINYQL